MEAAFTIYQKQFQPSPQLQQPYMMACLNVIVADTDDEAEYIATSGYQAFLGIIRGKRNLLQPPVKNMNAIWNEMEAAQIRQTFSASIIGSVQTVDQKLKKFISRTGIDELMVAAHIYDFNAKLHSYELLAEVMNVKSTQAFHSDTIQH